MSLSQAVLALSLVLSSGPAPVTADGFFTILQDKNDSSWSGGDQVTSLRAPNGLTYWTFGDTVLGSEDPATGGYADGWTMVANSILVQRGDEFTPAVAAPAVPAPNAGERYWTQGMFTTGGKLYVLCQRVANVDGGFELRGAEIARFAFTGSGALTLEAMLDTPSTGKVGGDTVATTQYSMDAVVSGGYVYVFGFRNAPEDTAFQPHRSYVARVPVAAVGSPGQWRFYSGGAWSVDMTAATPILNAQISSVRTTAEGAWLLAYKPWNGWGDTVYVERRAQPWSAAAATVTVSSPGGDNYVTYSPQLHPEQQLASGKLLLSIAWNGTTLGDLAADADLYKPRFYEITW